MSKNDEKNFARKDLQKIIISLFISDTIKLKCRQAVLKKFPYPKTRTI